MLPAPLPDPDHAAPVIAPVDDAWIRFHAGPLLAYALTRLRQRADAEDAVQETFVAALSALDRFRGESAERTWLIGILRHKIADRLRTAHRRTPLDEDETDHDTGRWTASGKWREPPTPWPEPQQLLERDELADQLRGCLGALPVRQAQLLIRRLVDGEDLATMAGTVGITANHCAVVLHRARLRLRDCLARWLREAP